MSWPSPNLFENILFKKSDTLVEVHLLPVWMSRVYTQYRCRFEYAFAVVYPKGKSNKFVAIQWANQSNCIGQISHQTGRIDWSIFRQIHTLTNSPQISIWSQLFWRNNQNKIIYNFPVGFVRWSALQQQ